MNHRLLGNVLIGLILLHLSGCKSRSELTAATGLHSQVITRQDQLIMLQRVLPKPIARAERPLVYEGEDIWLVGMIPSHVNPDSLYRAIRRRDFIRVKIRVFKGNLELTDSLFKPPWSDIRPLVSRAYAPIGIGDSTRWQISGLATGDYRAVVDAGVISDVIKFDVVPLPDSLKTIGDKFLLLADLRRRGDTGREKNAVPPYFWPLLRELTSLVLPYPVGTPIRMEALRLCLDMLPVPGLRNYQPTDSLTIWEVMRQYVREPRHEPNNVVWALNRICRYHGSESCRLQLAEMSGDSLILADVMNWQDELLLKNMKNAHPRRM